MTERTFFRHHSDKREVLFTGSEELQDLIVRAIESAPVDAPALEALSRSLELAGEFIDDRRSFVRARHEAVTASRDLHERELAKLAGLSTAITHALHDRGASDEAAALLGEVGVAVFKAAFERWIALAGPSLGSVVRDSFEELARALRPSDGRAAQGWSLRVPRPRTARRGFGATRTGPTPAAGIRLPAQWVGPRSSPTPGLVVAVTPGARLL